MIADFESRCGVCDRMIEVGDEIAKIDDEWCHRECAEAEDDGDDYAY